MKTDFKYGELTSRIIGSAMEVHSILGTGFQELIYQRALAEEFLLQNIKFHREPAMKVYYKNKPVGERRVDFLVEETISVELKALVKLEDVHLAQAINYLEAYNLEVGLLINFGAKSLEFRRFENKKYKPSNPHNLINPNNPSSDN
jgi:GxxExxY protein